MVAKIVNCLLDNDLYSRLGITSEELADFHNFPRRETILNSARAIYVAG
ncbi:hypothetical protein [Roseofilum casamattae]|uniref:Uncharacterized protein n=1 Tax=Roseofilum casamattae BLCC-M143 TaxID=3022442 RepID=A0ABT7BSS3_9CYAN|nr:hypothetical protein [Roseofilum casamattae]MDJ1182234.1 hypothetical protein [Roseofilum casamattae BLCC-M143]